MESDVAGVERKTREVVGKRKTTIPFEKVCIMTTEVGETECADKFRKVFKEFSRRNGETVNWE